MSDKLTQLYVDVSQILKPWVPEVFLTDITYQVILELELLRAKHADELASEVLGLVDTQQELEIQRERADRNEKALVAVIGMYRDIVEISRAQEQYEREIKQLEEMEKSL